MTPEDWKPAAVPRIRTDAIKGLRSDATMRAKERGWATLGDDDTNALAQLDEADLYWVSPDMSELCRDATDDLKEAHFGTDRWPSEVGFMVFATPIPLDGYKWKNANDQALEPIRAICWYPEDGLLGVLLFTDLDAMVAATAIRLGHTDPDDIRKRQTSFSASSGMKWLAACGGDMYPIDQPFDVSDREGTGAPACLS